MAATANSHSLRDLVALMERLRGPKGCPWDREQTLESLKTFLVEEAYEVLDALDSGDPVHHQEELGDLLFQIVFQARLREERGEFDLHDVLEGLHNKLVRRHPHVFGGEEVLTTEEALDRWERIKAEERGRQSPASLLDPVPATFPALLRALRLTEKAARVGFDWVADADLLKKLDEELEEFQTAVAGGQVGEMIEEMGDLLFVMANLARRHRLDPEEALRQANLKFQRRFGFMEHRCREAGRPLLGASSQELESLWEEAKRAEQRSVRPAAAPGETS